MSVEWDPRAIRWACRRDELEVFPSTLIEGRLCLNLVMMPSSHAEDFESFCRKNPVSCPLIHRQDPGDPMLPDALAASADLRTDLRSYDLIRHGEHVESLTRVDHLFEEDTVSFLIGSSVSFDGLLESRGWAPSWGPCIYLTQVAYESVGPFRGNMAVTMRTFSPDVADAVVEFTSHFPRCHGGPVCRDAPLELGIENESDQHLPWPGEIPGGDVRLYWACGITPSRVALQARLPWMIVHTPGNALVSDVLTINLCES